MIVAVALINYRLTPRSHDAKTAIRMKVPSLPSNFFFFFFCFELPELFARERDPVFSFRNNTAARKSFLEILVTPAQRNFAGRRRLTVLSSQLQPTSPFSARLYDRDKLPTTALSNMVSSRRIALHVETSAGLDDSIPGQG